MADTRSQTPQDHANPITEVDGVQVPVGHYVTDDAGNVVWHHYTANELLAIAAHAKAAGQKPGQAPPPAASKQQVAKSAATPQSAASGLDPSITQSGLDSGAAARHPGDYSAPTSTYDPSSPPGALKGPWDALSATSSTPANAQIAIGYSDPARIAAAGGMGASSYSGIYLDSNSSATNTDSLENLLRNFANSGPDEIRKVQQQLKDAGAPGQIVNGVADTSTIVAYRGILQNALLLQAAGQKITPDDLLTSLAKAKASLKPKTDTQTDVTLTNPEQARQAITTAYKDNLGRRPTDAEVAAFTESLHTYEQANPSTSTTVTQPPDANGMSSSSTTNTDKGTGSLNFVNDYAHNHSMTDPSTQPEFQAAQHLDFYNLALQALQGGDVNTGNTD